jgi:hypothetical protein
MAKPRIPIPTNPGEIIDLASSIEEQHTALGKASPLAMLEWDIVSPQIKDASAVQKQIDKISKELEKLTQRRNNLLDPIGEFVRSSRDILSGVYRSEMKKLGDFGYVVDDSPKAKKTKPAAPAK